MCSELSIFHREFVESAKFPLYILFGHEERSRSASGVLLGHTVKLKSENVSGRLRTNEIVRDVYARTINSHPIYALADLHLFYVFIYLRYNIL